MAKRSRSHTKRRKSRRGGSWLNPFGWGNSSTAGEQPAPAAAPAAATAPPEPLPVAPAQDAPPPPDMPSQGGRSRRRKH